MTWFTKWAFGNKAAVSILVAITLIVGVASYFTMPMEFMPEADNPQVTITTLGQGQDAKTMEDSVTTQIEMAVAQVKGKTSIFSTSSDGFSQVNINYDGKVSMKDAKQEIAEALAPLSFPPGVMKPFVVQYNTSMIPVTQASISFKDGLTPENIKLVQNDIVPRLQDVKGVGNVTLDGIATSSVLITPDNAKLTELGIPVQSLFGVLQGRSMSAAVSEEVIEGQTASIKVSSSINDVAQLENLQIATGVALKDVASVTLDNTQQSLAVVNSAEALFLVLSKEGSSNTVAVADHIEKEFEAIREDYPGVNAEIFFTTADMVKDSVDSMMKEVLLGALFATIVILFFLRNIRSTLITVVSIPLSLGITLFLLSRSGITLNILTLGGVAVSIGRLVDDSIVVIENIFRRSQKEKMSRSMIIDAVREVSTAITSSTLTTVAVFLPMGLLEGSLQAFLLPFALTLTYSLLASLFVSLTVVPIMSYFLLRNSTLKEHKRPERYIRILQWNLKHKWVPLVMSLLIFAGTIVGYTALPKGTTPQAESEYVFATMELPTGTPVETVREQGLKLEKFIADLPETKYTIMQTGNNPDSAKWGQVVASNLVMFNIFPNEPEDAQKVIDAIEGQKAQYADAKLEAGAGDLFGGGGGGASIDIDIQSNGQNLEAMQRTAADVIEKIKDAEHVLSVSSNQNQTKPVYTINVDPSSANAEELSGQLGSILNPTPIGAITLNGNITPVMLGALANPEDENSLGSIPVSNGGQIVSLSQVAKIEKSEQPISYYHKDGRPYIRVTALVDPDQVSAANTAITKELADYKNDGVYKTKDGVTLVIGGAAADFASDMTQLGLTMLASILIVYLIMVVTFKTIRAPIAILLSLPLAAVGSLVGLMVTNTSLEITAAFGALMLIGIVVTNAIVLIDRVKQNEQHMPIRESIIEAAATRMRPILMTAIATICAMLPLLFAEASSGSLVSKSLAVVVIGGLVSATLLTLVFVPAFYELLYFRKVRRQRRGLSLPSVNEVDEDESIQPAF